MADSFAHEFLDDYYAESEEHLAVLRGRLLAFEESGARDLATSEIRTIHRSLHTIKGLSGMVGFEEVESVAHALEDVLSRAPGGASSHAEMVELFYRGIQLLDRALAARRERRPSPDVSAFVNEVTGMTGRTDSVGLVRVDPPPGGEELVHVRFQPTSELLPRGMGVEWVRERLQCAGSIRTVVPMVPPGGGSVVFDFDVEMHAGWTPDPELEIDEITWSVYPAEPGPAGAGHRAQPLAGSAVAGNLVRVDLARLDELMRMVGELVVSRARLEETLDLLDVRAVPQAHALRETSEMMEPIAQERGLVLTVEYTKDSLPARTDPRHVRRILLSLIGNAVKFTARGSVTVRLESAADQALIRVVGIDQDRFEEIFEPFTRAEGRGYSPGGAGLGLALTRRLAQLIGGSVTCESQKGTGSIFTLCLALD